jgi:DNA-binding MarR family transcriptional regulator
MMDDRGSVAISSPSPEMRELHSNLKPLERRGLVKVSIDDADKRTRRLKLTRAGRALLVAAVPIWRQTHAQVDNLLPHANRKELRVDLRALS